MTKTVKELFKTQLEIQKAIGQWSEDKHEADPLKVYNSATAMILEIGEMLQNDTRWKEQVTGSKKEPVYYPTMFAEELADVCIYLMNVIIYANVSLDYLAMSIADKQETNKTRFGICE